VYVLAFSCCQLHELRLVCRVCDRKDGGFSDILHCDIPSVQCTLITVGVLL